MSLCCFIYYLSFFLVLIVDPATVSYQPSWLLWFVCSEITCGSRQEGGRGLVLGILPSFHWRERMGLLKFKVFPSHLHLSIHLLECSTHKTVCWTYLHSAFLHESFLSLQLLRPGGLTKILSGLLLMPGLILQQLLLLNNMCLSCPHEKLKMPILQHFQPL